MRRVAAAVGGALAIAASAIAQDVDPITAKESPRPVDRLDEAAKISAVRIVVGLTAASDHPLTDGDKLLVIAELPEDWGGESACMRLISPDALYEGMAEYAIDQDRAGKAQVVQFPISEEHWDKIRSTAGNLAVAFTKGECDGPLGPHAVVRWPEAEASQSRDVRLFVNSQGATKVFANLPGGTSIPCQRPEATGVGYDIACLLDLSASEREETVKVEVNRLSYGSFEDPLTVTLERLPGS